MNTRIAAQRLDNQRITLPGAGRPANLVAWLGAVQAQEYAAGKWALALRMRDGTTSAEIERALDAGRILRTHVLRPTWHFVTAADIRWMLDLTAPRVHRALAYANRHYELDAAVCIRATKILERALRNGESLTRTDLRAQLERKGVIARGIRLALLTAYAELEQVICSGPLRGKQFTYALLAHRTPHARLLSRDEALAELTKRYFRSHGPATVRDFVWWSGLTTADARRGLEICRARVEQVDGRSYWTFGTDEAVSTPPASVHLLPIYDEYLVAYRDLDAVPRRTLQPALIVRGQVAGTWKAATRAGELVVRVTTQTRLTGVDRRALARTAARLSRFLETPVVVKFDT